MLSRAGAEPQQREPEAFLPRGVRMRSRRGWAGPQRSPGRPVQQRREQAHLSAPARARRPVAGRRSHSGCAAATVRPRTHDGSITQLSTHTSSLRGGRRRVVRRRGGQRQALRPPPVWRADRAPVRRCRKRLPSPASSRSACRTRIRPVQRLQPVPGVLLRHQPSLDSPPAEVHHVAPTPVRIPLRHRLPPPQVPPVPQRIRNHRPCAPAPVTMRERQPHRPIPLIAPIIATTTALNGIPHQPWLPPG